MADAHERNDAPTIPERLVLAIDELRARLWFRPMAWLVMAFLAALTTRVGDALLLEWGWVDAVPGFLRADPEGARAVLGPLTTAMLTVTSLAFSLVMVVVVQTANAYSPRLLRDYLSDAANQHTLGILTGTFVYCLVALHFAGQHRGQSTLALSAGVLLALVSTVALVLFLNRVAQAVKVESIVKRIVSNTEDVIPPAFPSRVGVPPADPAATEVPDAPPHIVEATEGGYLCHVHGAEMLDLAREAGLIVRVSHRIGDFVFAGMPLLSVWGLPQEETIRNDLEARLRRTCVLGEERRFRSDPLLGIAQLRDVALRALSPAVNAPGTAVQATLAIATLLVKLVETEPSPMRCDAGGQLRIAALPLELEAVLAASLVQVLEHGRTDSMVLRQLSLVAGHLRMHLPQVHIGALWRFLTTVAEAGDALENPMAREAVLAAAARGARRFRQPLPAHLQPTEAAS